MILDSISPDFTKLFKVSSRTDLLYIGLLFLTYAAVAPHGVEKVPRLVVADVDDGYRWRRSVNYAIEESLTAYRRGDIR